MSNMRSSPASTTSSTTASHSPTHGLRRSLRSTAINPSKLAECGHDQMHTDFSSDRDLKCDICWRNRETLIQRLLEPFERALRGDLPPPQGSPHEQGWMDERYDYGIPEPVPEPTPEEIAAKKKADEERAKKREQARMEKEARRGKGGKFEKRKTPAEKEMERKKAAAIAEEERRRKMEERRGKGGKFEKKKTPGGTSVNGASERGTATAEPEQRPQMEDAEMADAPEIKKEMKMENLESDLESPQFPMRPPPQKSEADDEGSVFSTIRVASPSMETRASRRRSIASNQSTSRDPSAARARTNSVSSNATKAPVSPTKSPAPAPMKKRLGRPPKSKNKPPPPKKKSLLPAPDHTDNPVPPSSSFTGVNTFTASPTPHSPEPPKTAITLSIPNLKAAPVGGPMQQRTLFSFFGRQNVGGEGGGDSIIVEPPSKEVMDARKNKLRSLREREAAEEVKGRRKSGRAAASGKRYVDIGSEEEEEEAESA